MILFFRKLLFWIFCAVYLVGCPLLILYAFGIVVSPEQKRILVETGCVYLATVPEGARVGVDGRELPDQTPALSGPLEPGFHEVTARLTGYEPWVKSLQVKPGRTTIRERLILVPEKWKTRVLLQRPFTNLVPTDARRFFLLKTGRKLEEHFIFDCNEKSIRPVAPEGHALSKCAVTGAYFVPGSSEMVLKLSDGGKKRYLRAQSRGPRPVVAEITDLVQENSGQIQWDGSGSDDLFAFAKGNLWRSRLGSRAVSLGYLENIRGFAAAFKTLFVLTRDNRLLKTDFEKAAWTELATGEGHKRFVGKTGRFRLFPLSEDLVLLVGKQGELLSNLPPWKLWESGVKGLTADRTGSRVLVWTRERLGAVNSRKAGSGKREAGNGRQGPGGTLELEWFAGGAKNLRQAFWAFDSAYCIYRDGHDVYLVPALSGADDERTLLARVREGTSVFYSDETGLLYYLEEHTGALVTLRVLAPNYLAAAQDFIERERSKLVPNAIHVLPSRS